MYFSTLSRPRIYFFFVWRDPFLSDFSVEIAGLCINHVRTLPWVHLVWERHYRNGKLPSSTKKGSFWWHDILGLLDTFKGMSSPVISSGSTCRLWYDLWYGAICHQVFQICSRLQRIRLSQSISQQAWQKFQIFSSLLSQLLLIANFSSWWAFWLRYLKQ